MAQEIDCKVKVGTESRPYVELQALGDALTDEEAGLKVDVGPVNFVGAVDVAPGQPVPPYDQAGVVLAAPTEEEAEDLYGRFSEGILKLGLAITMRFPLDPKELL